MFDANGLNELTCNTVPQNCRHYFKKNFLSFSEPILFNVEGKGKRKNRTVKLFVSRWLEEMFVYEDDNFYKILEAIPKMKFDKTWIPILDFIKYVAELDPVGYNSEDRSRIYEVRMKGFLCQLAMGFYTHENERPERFVYKSIMLWDRLEPVAIHVYELGGFVKYLMDNTYISLKKVIRKGKKYLELQVRITFKKYS